MLSIFIIHTYIVGIVHIKTHNNICFWEEKEENYTGKKIIGTFNFICRVLFLLKLI